MREFVVVGNKAVTSPFNLKNLPGSGRMDILCRCINSCFFLSHDIRRDTRLWLVLRGEPDPPKILRFEGSELKHLNPDEWSTGALISKALEKGVNKKERLSTPGIYIRRGDLEDVIGRRNVIYLHEDGIDIRKVEILEPFFVLGDHIGLTERDELLLKNAKKVSVGPKSLHADHCIIIVHNELDRRSISH
ncbi:MAG: tRNA (pseudouridine(54)-N(1))-methyltransferase TrmY [Candidatus Syntropharchaeia archaeon]